MSPANGTAASPSADTAAPSPSVSTSSSPTKSTVPPLVPKPRPRPRPAYKKLPASSKETTSTPSPSITTAVAEPTATPSESFSSVSTSSPLKPVETSSTPSSTANTAAKHTAAPSGSFSSASTSSPANIVPPLVPKPRPRKLGRPTLSTTITAAKPKAAPSLSFSSVSISSSSPPPPTESTVSNPASKPRQKPRPAPKRPLGPGTVTRRSPRRSMRGSGASEPLLQLGSPSRDHKPAVRIQSKASPALEDSAMSSSISAAGTGGGMTTPALSASVNYNAAATATPTIATSTSALATPTATSPTAISATTSSTMATMVGIGGVGDGEGTMDPTQPWNHPDELEYICREDWGQDRMITYLCHHAFSILPREAPLPILNPELIATDDSSGNGSAKTTIYQHNLYQTLGAAAIPGGGAIGNTTTKTKSKPNPFVGIVLKEPTGSYADSYSPNSSPSASPSSPLPPSNDTSSDKEQTGNTVVYLPRGYRIPLMFVGKFQWESLRLVLTSGNPDGEWEEFKFDIVHLSRLCSHFLRTAERVCKEDLGSGATVGVGSASSPSIGGVNASSPVIGGGTPSVAAAAANKSQANKEPRIGAMDRHWRCPMFDRALVRFYRKWMICREWSVKLFWEEFGEEEYEFDVLKHDWARWVLKGHKGFLCTKEEVEGGITADQYTAGLDRMDEGKWVWDNEKYVQSRNGIALVGGSTTTGSVNGIAGAGVVVNGTGSASANGTMNATVNGNQNANASGGATAPEAASSVVASPPTPTAPALQQGDIGLQVKKEAVEAVIPPSVSPVVGNENGVGAAGQTNSATTTTVSSATTPIVPIVVSSVSANSVNASTSIAKPAVVIRTASQASYVSSTATTPGPTPTSTIASTASAVPTAVSKTTNGTVPTQVAGKKRARTEDEESPAAQGATPVAQKAGEAQPKVNGKEKEKERDESERKRVKVMEQAKEKEKEGSAKAPSTTSTVTSRTTTVQGSVSKPQQALPTPPQTSASTSTSTTVPPQKQPATATTAPVKHAQAILEYLGHRIVIRRDQNGKGTVDDLSKVPFVKGATLKFSIAPSESSSDPKNKEAEKEADKDKDKEKKGKGWTFSWEEEIRAPLVPSSALPPGYTAKKAPARWFGEWRPPYIKFVPGDTWGLVGFHRAIVQEEVQYVRQRVPSIGGKSVVWELLNQQEERAFQIERAQVAARTAFVQLDESVAATLAPTNNATTSTPTSTAATKATAASTAIRVPTPPKEKDENAMDVDEGDGDVTMRPAGEKDAVVQEPPSSRSSAPVNQATTTATAKEKAVDPKALQAPVSPWPSDSDDYDESDWYDDLPESDEDGVSAGGDKVDGAEKEKIEEPVKNSQKVTPRSSAFTIKKPLYTKPTGKLNSVPPPAPPPPPPPSSSTVEAAKQKTGEKRKLDVVDVVDEKDLSPSLERTLSTKLEDAVRAITSKIREEFEGARQRDLVKLTEERKREERERRKEVEDIRQVVEEVKLQIIEFQQQTQSYGFVKHESRQPNAPLPPETAKILEALLGLLEGNKRLTNLVTNSREGVEEILVTVVDLVAEVCKESKKFGEEQRSVREEVDRRMGDVVRGVEDVVHEVVATKSIVVDRRNENETQRAADEIERAEREKRVVDEVERRMEGRFGMVMEGIRRLDKELGRERERRRGWEEDAVLRRQPDEARLRVSRVESAGGSGSGVRAVEVSDVGIQAEPVEGEDRALVKRRRLDVDVTMVDLHQHQQQESASTASAMKHSNPSKAKKVLDVMRNMADILEFTSYDEESRSAELVERHQTVSAKGKERQRDPDLWVETRSESTLLSLLLDEFKLIKDQLRASERRGREEIATLRLLHSAEMEKLRSDLSREGEETDGGGIAGLRSGVDRRVDEAWWGRDRERDRDRRQRDDYAGEGSVSAEISELRKRLAQLESRTSHSQQPPPMSASVSGSTPEPQRRERSSSIASSSNFEPRVGSAANGNSVAGGSAGLRGSMDWNRRAGSAVNGHSSAGPSRRPSVSVADALDVDVDSPSVPLPVKTQRKLMRGMPPPD